MPAKKSKNSNPKYLFVKVMVVLSIIGNIFFITLSIGISVMLASKESDFFIWNMALSREGINYNAPGGCMQLSSDLAKKYSTLLDAKGRVLSNGKVMCIVQITPQEADAIQQKLDSENILPPKQ